MKSIIVIVICILVFWGLIGKCEGRSFGEGIKVQFEAIFEIIKIGGVLLIIFFIINGLTK